MCEWCGHDHPREALCLKRPKWNRRGFLALFGIGIAGALLPTPCAADFPWKEFLSSPVALNPASGDVIAAAWESYITATPVDNIFNRHWLLEQYRSADLAVLTSESEGARI